MDPVLKSTLTSLAMSGVGYVLGWAVTKHYLTPDQASALTTDIVSGGIIAIGGILLWYKGRQHTQTAMIQEVKKADNGVTVVSEASAAAAGIVPVNGPLK